MASPFFRKGVKVYSTDWYLKYNLDYEDAAARLREQGFDFVIAQNRFLPMADSAVKSEVLPEQEERYKAYEDSSFARALQAAGIEYWAACNLFFDTQTLARHPDALPVDASGTPAEMIDWYLGVCPTHDGYFNEKLEQLHNAVSELRPDGVFLGFTRFPGFWELWLPECSRSEFPEYCYCERCLTLSSEAKRVHVPAGDTRERAQWIQREAYGEFVDWKTDVVRDRVGTIRSKLKEIHPGIRLMLNTVPFRQSDFEDAGREVFAQDWSKLAEVIDVFELMTYHQIMGQDAAWAASLVSDFKRVVDRPAVCTIQAEPLYIDGMHAGRGRAEEVPVDEFRHVATAVEKAGADGLIVFTWSDFLEQELAGATEQINVVRAAGR